jgi:hypothetical protein
MYHVKNIHVNQHETPASPKPVTTKFVNEKQQAPLFKKNGHPSHSQATPGQNGVQNSICHNSAAYSARTGKRHHFHAHFFH